MEVALDKAEHRASGPANTSSRFSWKSRDGLTLSGCIWEPAAGTTAPKVPVLCLPGLSRNTRDFNRVADFLQKQGHRVIALDYRGRGQSDWDADWQNYALTVEDGDIDDAIAKLGLDRFAVLGTSRGGLHAMMMAQRYEKRRLAAVILNDIGPHIEMRGVHRLAATIGRNMTFADKHAHAALMKHNMEHQFPRLCEQDWLDWVDQLASGSDGKWKLDYDPALGHTLATLDEGAPWPDLWPLYKGLEGIPVLIIHGQTSDLLTAESCQKMLDELPGAKLHVVPDEGHAPLLWDRPTQSAISNFIETAEAKNQQAATGES
ncbi:pimeloyl-ACP methyl ester carboxylesterase [Roseibium hamelinense]|uniref:Pimeloyl-ACP methyl ester carboxylesterase n=1 Tax=Roseibium hamelinense TaxID=150831 RepID=A0A562TI73_9HYPH|nr:alpha/beta hydrolase [Roseibium hamelinense]MTI42371.1 alpha/beta hydrolase [Roseibium hamelinense]TWI92576.1 pimeloyl-ACP methyl ester carboxylesterase [Roseibium hamelinense]